MNSLLPQSKRDALQDLLLAAVLFSTLFGILLGNRPLAVPDEGRYVEIPREMVATGDYVTPRLNGVKYFEKPVLFYWLESLSIRLFGLREFTLRLWPALFAVIGCLAVYAGGRRLYNRRTGLIAAAVLSTSMLYYALSRAIILDMPVTALLTLALLSFLVGSREPAGWLRRLLLYGFYVFAALAVLTKGLIGILIPVLVIGSWILLLGQRRMLRDLYLPTGLALFLAVAAPWHILVDRANPEFFNFYFIHEHFLRYLTKIHSRYQPAWFFIPVLLVGLFPWTAFLVQAVRFNLPKSWRGRHEHGDALFLLLWAGLVFLFFSASSSKLVPYILPVLPPLALLIGRYLASAWTSREAPEFHAGIAAVSLAMLLFAAALIALPFFVPMPQVLALGNYPALVAALLGVVAVSTWLLDRTRGIRWSLPALAVGMAVLLIALNATAGRVQDRSVKPLAEVLKQRLKPGDEVASYLTYYQDLPVYLERRITVVDWSGELEFGMSVEDTSGWMIRSAEFWKRWQRPARIYVFTKRSVYDILRPPGKNKIYLVAGTEDTVLLTNREP
jgi:4-amino-4-deoxy-L-arabinose transferase-like glycosyltransferase